MQNTRNTYEKRGRGWYSLLQIYTLNFCLSLLKKLFLILFYLFFSFNVSAVHLLQISFFFHPAVFFFLRVLGSISFISLYFPSFYSSFPVFFFPCTKSVFLFTFVSHSHHLNLFVRSLFLSVISSFFLQPHSHQFVSILLCLIHSIFFFLIPSIHKDGKEKKKS